jgi:hypothetical protein
MAQSAVLRDLEHIVTTTEQASNLLQSMAGDFSTDQYDALQAYIDVALARARIARAQVNELLLDRLAHLLALQAANDLIADLVRRLYGPAVVIEPGEKIGLVQAEIRAALVNADQASYAAERAAAHDAPTEPGAARRRFSHHEPIL